MVNYKIYSDEELAGFVRLGSHEAFAEIYQRYWAMLLRHARKMLQDNDDCKDILQEVFVSFWNQAGRLTFEKSTLASYLYTLTRNRVLNQMSKEKTKHAYLASISKLEESGDLFADRDLLRKELESEIERELGRLPQKMREVFELSRKHSLSHQEIASKLNISKFTVKKQINNVLHRMRSRLGVAENELKIKKSN